MLIDSFVVFGERAVGKRVGMLFLAFFNAIPKSKLEKPVERCYSNLQSRLLRHMRPLSSCSAGANLVKHISTSFSDRFGGTWQPMIIYHATWGCQGKNREKIVKKRDFWHVLDLVFITS